MPKAEKGSIKDLAKKMKAKGLQRLRWYCQVCEKQMRDENGFKQHTQSEGHVRQMLVVGENPQKHISDFSRTFQHDFVQLLRSSHGTKKVHYNHFYQEYIANKQHLHMNGTRWSSLAEFCKHLGRCGIVKVEQTEKGYFLSWIDNSPDALARQEAIRKRDRLDKGDGEREKLLIQNQVERAHEQAGSRDSASNTSPSEFERREEKAIHFQLGKPPEEALSMANDGSMIKTLSLTLATKVQPKKGNVFAMAKRKAATEPAPKVEQQRVDAIRSLNTAEEMMLEEKRARERRERRQLIR